MIDLKTLRNLIKLMKDNDLSELDLRDKDEQVTLKRAGHGSAGAPVVMHAPATAHHHAPAPAAVPAAGAAPSGGENDGLVAIKSPMVGTFYSSPSPDADVFVRIGDRVDDDSVICIIEAMKVFNEIKAETAGTIAKTLVSNGQAVEFGQPLFLVKPD